jgi:hypothetical protein
LKYRIILTGKVKKILDFLNKFLKISTEKCLSVPKIYYDRAKYAPNPVLNDEMHD